MKTKILINNEQVEITLTPEQVEAITAQQKPKQWEPQGGDYTITYSGRVHKIFSTKRHSMFGIEYKTQAQAEKARDAMRSHNRLLAWLAENDDGWVADWKDVNKKKYYIYFDICDYQYKTYSYITHKVLSTIYMSEQNAEKLCKLLNSGEVVL